MTWITAMIVISIILSIIGFFAKKAIKLLIFIWLAALAIMFIDEVFGLTILDQIVEFFKELLNRY